MTRKEEIENAMKESVCETVYSSGYGFTPQATDLLECAFTKGAEWADKTMPCYRPQTTYLCIIRCK